MIEYLSKKSGRLGRKLLGPFLLIALVALIGAAISVYISSKNQRAFSEQLQQKIAIQAAGNINDFVENLELALRDGANRLAEEIDHPDEYRSILKGIRKLSPVFHQLTLIDLNGQELEKIIGFKPIPQQELANLIGDPKFTEALAGQTYIGPVYISEFDFPFVSISVPVFDEKQQVNGVLSAEVDISQMWNDVTEIANQHQDCPGSSGNETCATTIYVIDQSGNLIAINSNTARTRGLPNLAQSNVPHPEIADGPIEGVQAFLAGNFTPSTYPGIKNEAGQQEKVIGTRENVPGAGWGVIVERPLNVVNRQINQFVLISGLLITFILLITILTGAYITRYIIQPLNTLRVGVGVVAQGQFDHKINVKTGDELEFLANEFNEMSTALQQSQQSLALAAHEKAQLYQDAQRRIDELAVINQINHTVMASLDIETTIDAVLRNMQTLFEYQSAEINLWNPEEQYLKAYAVGDTKYTASVGYQYKPGEGYTGWITEHKKSLLISSVGEFTETEPKRPAEQFPFKSYVGLPLTVGQDFLGTLELAHLESGHYIQEDLTSLETLAGQAALAIRHARLFQESHERALAQKQLAEIAALASTTLNLNELLKRILSKTVEALNGEKGILLLLNEDETKISPHPASAVGYDLAAVNAFKLSTDLPQIEQTVLYSGRPFFSNNTETDTRILPFYQPFLTKFAINSVLVAPLATAEKKLGEIHIHNKSTPFTNRDVTFLSSVAGQFAVAIHNATLALQNAQLYRETDEQLKRRIKELDGLQKVNRQLNSTLILKNITQLVIREAVRATGADLGNVSLYDAKTHRLITHVHEGWPQEAIEAAPEAIDLSSIMGRVFRTNIAEIINDVSKDPDYVPFPISTRSEMVVPIRFAGSVIDTGAEKEPLAIDDTAINIAEGVINIESTRLGAFTQDQLQYVQALANQAGIAIRNARAFDEQIQERREAAGRANQLARLSEIGQAFRANQPLEFILEEISFAIQETVGFSIVLLSVTKHDMLYSITGAGIPLADLNEYRKVPKPVEVIEALFQAEFKLGESYFIPAEKRQIWEDKLDILIVETPHPDQERQKGWQDQDLLLTPLRNTDGNLIGLLSVDAPDTGLRPTIKDVISLELFAIQAATAIENANLFNELRMQTTQLKLAGQISARISAILNPAELMGEVVNLIAEAFNYYYVQIYQLDAQRPTLLCVRNGAGTANVGPKTLDPDRRLTIDENSIIGWVAKNQRPLLVNNTNKEPLFLFAPHLPHTLSEMAVPLRAGTALAGVLDIQHNQLHAFTVDDLENLQTLADQLSIAIQNARLFDEALQRERLSSALGNTGLAINATLNPETIFDVICEEAVAAFNVDGAYLWMVNQDNAEGVAGAGPNRDIFVGQVFPLAEKQVLGVRIIREQRAEFINGVDFTKEGISQSMAKQMNARSIMGAPLIAGERTIGSIVLIDNHNPNRFDMQDRISLTLLANQAAIAVENARLIQRLNKFTEDLEQRVESRTEELRQERDRVDTLYNIARELSSSLDLDRVLNEALGLINWSINVSKGSILMIDDGTGMLIYRAAIGRKPPLPKGGKPTRYKIGVGLAGTILETRKPVIIPNLQENKDWLPDNKPMAHHSVLAVPLITGYEIVGVMMLFHTEKDYFTEDHLRLVTAAAPIIATAINNAGLYNLISDQVERLGILLGTVRAEARKNEAIVEGIADGVLVLDADNNIQLINPAACAILNLEAAALQDQSLDQILALKPSTIDERLAYNLYRTITNYQPNPDISDDEPPTPHRLEIEAKVVLVTISSTTLSANAPPSKLVVLRDISREAEIDRIQNEFVSTVSHELRTPMTSIKGYTDLLVSDKVGPLTDLQRKFIQVIKNNADRLTGLVNDILEISRIDTGRAKLTLAYIDLHPLINNLISTFTTQVDEKELSLTVNMPKDLPPAFADANRVTQILFNLYGNAVKYTSPGDAITLTVNPCEHYLQIDVTDTGLGLSEEDAKHVFDRFFRAERDATSLVDGTGLGLPIAKMFVEMMGGELWIESELGVGSTFSFTLPLEDQRIEESRVVDSFANRRRILVVDDNKDVLDVLKRQLEVEGYNVITSLKGKNVLELAKTYQPSLITLDIMLGDIDGFEVLEQLKADPTTKEIPVVIVSVLNDIGKQGLALGAADYITKPFDKEDVLNTVHKLLNALDVSPDGQNVNNILVVDDDKDIVNWLRNALASGGFNVRGAYNGQEAILLARENKPDLILLDLKMPGMDGFEVIEKLRGEVATVNIPVIVITGSSIDRKNDKIKMLGLGANQMLTKPFSLDQLVSEIKRLEQPNPVTNNHINEN